MSIIDRIRSAAATRAQSSVQAAVTSVVPGLLGETLAGAVMRGITQGPKGFRSVIPNLKNAAPDLILGEVERRSAEGFAASKRQAEQLASQAAGRPVSLGPPPVGGGTPRAKPEFAPPTTWTPAPVWGGLSLDEYRRIFVESAMTAKAFKNLFYVSITDLKPSKEAPNGAGGFNLFALDVSFAPYTMPGDSVAIGSANMDNLQATERVELRITTLDDSRGSLKRWFAGKADQAAREDGTFGVPADYLMVIEVTHMATALPGRQDPRLSHRWLMRVSNIDHELSRRAPELEELQMSFVQFDTFVKPP